MKTYWYKLLTGFDWLLERLWELIKFACLIVWSILCFFGRGPVLIWHRLGKIEKTHGVWLVLSSIFRFIEAVITVVMFLPVKFFVFLKGKLDKSARNRRVIFVIVIILYLLIMRPFLMPWNWGTWRDYERGIASWYGPGFYFQKTKSGDWFLPGPFMTAAHKTLPMGTKVLVRNVTNGREAVVVINDRGPFVKGRIIDLSWFAAWRLGFSKKGTAPVAISVRPEISIELEKEKKAEAAPIEPVSPPPIIDSALEKNK